MYHSLIFQADGETKKYNTWDHWHLIPSSRPTFVQPSPVYKYIDIPGADGQKDLTNYLIGRPTYSNRQGSFEFIVANGWGDWFVRRTELAKYFTGRYMKCYLEDEPKFYYYGRFFFKDWKSDANFSKVTIEYQVKPYRYNKNGEEAGL